MNRSTETEINLAFSNNLGAFGGRKDAIFKVHLVRSCDADLGAYPAQSEGWLVIFWRKSLFSFISKDLSMSFYTDLILILP